MSDIRPHLRPVDDGDSAVPESPAENWDGVTRPSRRGGPPRFLTDVLVDLELVSRERADEAIAAARVNGSTPERTLVEAGALADEGLARAVAERHGLDLLDLSAFSVDVGAASLISTAAARRYEAVPVAFVDDRTLTVAMADPANVLAIDDIAIMTGYEVRPAVATRDDIAGLVSRLGRFDDVVADTIEESRTRGGDLRIRFRIDGVLQEATTVPRRMALGVVSRIKIMSDLDIAERRLPQDGRVGFTVDGNRLDLRVVTLPTVHGESIVMRVLDKDAVVMNLESLGMPDDEQERFSRAFGQAHGAVLATGPTGSGKSTTLYAALQTINTPEKNIITIEDPVEYQLEGVTQVQVNLKAGLSFANGLRSMMRADPDVIMVGEIRDRETARIAVESALTGHLVLSTLHTNDAPSAITRLLEMGIEPFLVASAIDCVVAQRLARTLCSHCKRRTILSVDVLRANGFHSAVDIEAYEPVGCNRCSGSGYKGRIGLYEVMTMSEEIRRLTIERQSADRIAEVALREGMHRLRDDGIAKVKLGRTSIAEIARVTGSL
ncbi:MAG: Flp pilus assembly complex ATPase component TadA [Actinobacteria bacterium]|nr:Flp pilus assembly complex ATPase component TadA [Actinomycetota bacterium]